MIEIDQFHNFTQAFTYMIPLLLSQTLSNFVFIIIDEHNYRFKGCFNIIE